MKSMVQVTDAIKNIKDLEDFQFAQKVTLTGIIMVSHLGGIPPSWAVWGSHSADLRPSEAQGGQGSPRPHLSQFCFDLTVGVLCVTFLYLIKVFMARKHSGSRG